MKILYAVIVSSLLIGQAQADLGARLQVAQSQINSLRAHTDSTNLTPQIVCASDCGGDVD